MHKNRQWNEIPVTEEPKVKIPKKIRTTSIADTILSTSGIELCSNQTELRGRLTYIYN